MQLISTAVKPQCESVRASQPLLQGEVIGNSISRYQPARSDCPSEVGRLCHESWSAPAYTALVCKDRSRNLQRSCYFGATNGQSTIVCILGALLNVVSNDRGSPVRCQGGHLHCRQHRDGPNRRATNHGIHEFEPLC